jgi:hypothetical protein
MIGMYLRRPFGIYAGDKHFILLIEGKVDFSLEEGYSSHIAVLDITVCLKVTISGEADLI